jgi:hypothetical protein
MESAVIEGVERERAPEAHANDVGATERLGWTASEAHGTRRRRSTPMTAPKIIARQLAIKGVIHARGRKGHR